MMFEAFSLAMRYWFVVVIFIVLAGSVGISIREYRQKSVVLGIARSSIGYLNVVSGPDDVLGENLQLMEENTIGRSRRVDIMLGDRSIDKVHCLVHRDENGDVCISRMTDADITINGAKLEESAILFSGDMICLGNVVTQLHIKEDEEE